MLGIIVLPLSTMVTCKETRAVIIALNKRGLQARILLPVRLHLNQPFIRSSRTSKREVELL